MTHWTKHAQQILLVALAVAVAPAISFAAGPYQRAVNEYGRVVYAEANTANAYASEQFLIGMAAFTRQP